MLTQAEKGRRFRELHERARIFAIPNPWDVGTARLLAHLGFEALATTSAGYAFSRGLADGEISREEMMEHVGEVSAATDLPVNADLGNGFGDAPEIAAETIRLTAGAGACGGSIEDYTGRAGHPIYDVQFAAERVRAAVEAARGLAAPFLVVGRAENYLHGRPDLKDTIARLQAYQEAGADVLYAPGLKSGEDIKAVVKSVDRPVNVVMGLQGAELGLKELDAIGVRRVSVGSALNRAALGELLRAAREILDNGTFTFYKNAPTVRELGEIFRKA